jgi:hypothetical protein
MAITPLKEGTTNVPQQAFQQYNDPYGNKLLALNRDGSIFVQEVNFPDGTSITTAAGGFITDLDAGTF